MAIGILGTGSYLPEQVVTNDDLARVVDTSDEWIVSHTGIRQRRRAGADTRSSDLGILASRRAVSAAGLSTEQIDGLVVASSSPDQVQPATACRVQAELGLMTGPAFDVSAVCAGFVYGVAVAQGLMCASGQYRRMLVTGCEVYSKILDYQDRTSCVFFGDGAGAVVLGHVPDGYGILGSHLTTDGTQRDVVGIPAGGTAEPTSADTLAARRHHFRMDGPRVWDFATTALPVSIKQALAATGLGVADVDLLITHQANLRLIDAVAHGLGMPREKVPTTVERYGNTAAASVPITLDEAVAAGRLRRGDIVVLAAVGGGMTAGTVVLRWY
ncbi:3-oxoacyl-ACP synthase III family protein [Micromonospora mirobrigensis]|uniref:Beta-ketoacyl-[acyl-carrier-protein] synthase III n=1 Tax=Micromonospora mirobrigensis TaxID=262898 RepID=A0A1C4V151_9ACTN|nr:beta-ketoacyl-ACP synthase III [Micromonospora mirobrigensis]SCE77577.1 3-oxoacyl-[acyl-carrier-protein] synthase-3 [Micromonospora mirobrigensis]